MLSVAIGYAESCGAEVVLIGAHAGDHFVYLDCREEFIQSMSTTAELGTGDKVHIFAPFNTYTKDAIIAWGLEHNVPYDMTWSCYNGQEKSCLKCGTCRERQEAFYINKVKDPLLTDEEWASAIKIIEVVKQK